MTAKEIKARAAQLREQRGALEGRLAGVPPDQGRALRLELAAIEEELVDCARELRALTPRHRVSYTRATWGDMEGLPWGSIDTTWAKVEALEAGEPPPTDQDLMRLALRTALARSMTPTQTEYMQAAQTGEKAARIGRAHGRDRSTVSRTLKRGRAHMEQHAKAMYAVLKSQQGNGDAITLDLANPQVLAAVLDVLTPKQRLCMYLYYGEWLSTREISGLTGQDHASVLRCIRRGLERIDQIMVGSKVVVTGLDALEEQLILYYNAAELEVLLERPETPPARRSRGGHHPWQFAPGCMLPRAVTVIRAGVARTLDLSSAELRLDGAPWGSGRLLTMLRQWLAERSARLPKETTRAALVRTLKRYLYKLFDQVRRMIHADDH